MMFTKQAHESRCLSSCYEVDRIELLKVHVSSVKEVPLICISSLNTCYHTVATRSSPGEASLEKGYSCLLLMKDESCYPDYVSVLAQILLH